MVYSRESALSQKARLGLLALEILILCFASWLAFDQILPPPGNNKGFWFYTALLGLILGSRLDTPFFAKPADVVVYAAPAAVTLALVHVDTQWTGSIEATFWVSVIFCIFVGFLGIIAILTKDTQHPKWQQASNAVRVLAETLGAPRIIYSVLIAFSLLAFHSEDPKEFGFIIAAWVLTALLSPLEGSFRIWQRLKRIFKPNTILNVDGEVVAYQTPGLILIRQSESRKVKICDILAVHDPLKKIRFAIALDLIGRDQGLLLRTVEIPVDSVSSVLRDQLSSLPPNSVVCVSQVDQKILDNPLVKAKEDIVGLVAPDTTIERLFFEVVKNDGLEEGRLVEVPIGNHMVTYQVVNGITKEEIVQQKNTHGYARAQAQKIGEWDATAKKFKVAKWLPMPNAPVLLKSAKDFRAEVNAIGHFPGTDYPVNIKNINELVTHNTAILGILGVGKSMLAIELVERMLVAGIKVICIDLTDQYAAELAPFYDSTIEAPLIARLKTIGSAGQANVQLNVEDGGSKKRFIVQMLQDMDAFLNPGNIQKLRIYNPSSFEVWRQDSRPYNNTASMASLTPAELTHIISDATLQAAIKLGMTNAARACLVYEEAHSLVPEWNSTVGEGDRAASNGSSRSILQGRKYGLGCLLITQRTANVTKTILNQCNTIFAMRTFDETGKDFLANYIGKDYANSLSSIPERHAVFFGKASSCENPVLVRLNDRAAFVAAFRAVNPLPIIPAVVVPAAVAVPANNPAQPVPPNITPSEDDDLPF